MKKILKSTKYIRRNVSKKRDYSRKVFQLTRDSILRTSAGTQCRQVTRDDRVYKYSSFTRNSRRVGSRYRYTTRRNTARIQYNRSSMGFHEAVLVIGSSSSPFLPSYRHRSHPSRFPIILSARKTLAGLILRDAMSSILLAIDRQFPPPFPSPVSTIPRDKCKLSLLSRSAAPGAQAAIQSPCFAPRGNVVNRKDWIPCISDRGRNSFPLLLIASAWLFFFQLSPPTPNLPSPIFAFILQKKLKTSSAPIDSLSLSLFRIYPIFASLNSVNDLNGD